MPSVENLWYEGAAVRRAVVAAAQGGEALGPGSLASSTAARGDLMAENQQVALVTGSGRGIGRAIALRLAGEGSSVCINYAGNAEAANQVAAEINAADGRAIAVQADVADPEAVDRMVRRTEAELGPLSILVNNAGVGSGGAGSLEAFDPERMARMRAVNADGVIHTIRAVAPGMKARLYGRIVNVASNAAIGTGLPGTTFYAATKAEVLILTRRFAMELGRFGITVNAIAPGWIVTDMTRSALSEEAFAERVRMLSERAMVGRAGRPEDIAHAAAFLASPAASFVTAQVMTVDGGRMDYIGHG